MASACCNTTILLKARQTFVATSTIQYTIHVHPGMIQLPLPTYQQSSSSQQGLDSTHSQCTPHSFPSLEPDVGHSCRMLLNHLLCQWSLLLIHFGGYKENHSQLGESGIELSLISFVTWLPADQQHTVYLFLNVTFYSLHNIAEVPGLHLWVKSWHHDRVILLILKYKSTNNPGCLTGVCSQV